MNGTTIWRWIEKNAGDRHLLTGSRVYGRPRDDSDTDVVVWAAEDAVESLCREADTYYTNETNEYEGATILGLRAALRFGEVNVLLVTEEWQWRAWVTGTRQLTAEAPVTRDRAVEVFQSKFKECRDELRV
jgi:hypothetical protein